MQTYHTQMEAARKNIITPQMKTVAEKERVDVEWLRERVAAGTICIPARLINHVSHTYIYFTMHSTSCDAGLAVKRLCCSMLQTYLKAKHSFFTMKNFK